MINIYKTGIEENTLKKLSQIEVGSWINLIAPTEEEIKLVIQVTGIEDNIIEYALSNAEKSRVDIEKDQVLILIDVPMVEEKGKYKFLTTETLGILVIDDKFIVTMSNKQLDIFAEFENNAVKGFFTEKKTKFILQILSRISNQYLKNLKLIKEATDKADRYLQTTTKNKELLYLLNIDKSLVFLTTSLQYNAAVFERFLKGNILPVHQEDLGILEETLIKTKQAIDIAEIYKNILKSMMNVFATITSNNLNTIMKFLAGITIILSIPTMIASFMGMNVPLGMYNISSYAFPIIVGISLFLAIIVAIILRKKNML